MKLVARAEASCAARGPPASMSAARDGHLSVSDYYFAAAVAVAAGKRKD